MSWPLIPPMERCVALVGQVAYLVSQNRISKNSERVVLVVRTHIVGSW